MATGSTGDPLAAGIAVHGLVEGRPSHDSVCFGSDRGGEGYARVEEPPHPGNIRPGGEVAHAYTVVRAVDDGDGVACAHQAGFMDFEHGADPAGGVEADVEVVETDAHRQVLAGGPGHPHLEQDRADPPLLSDDRAADVEVLGAEVLCSCDLRTRLSGCSHSR
jgi:hypothetical protein